MKLWMYPPTSLIEDDRSDVGGYIQSFIDRFAEEVSSRIAKLS